MSTVISVENLSKSYHLGQIGTGTFTHDLAVWWAKLRGKPNPMLRIGEKDHSNRDGEEIWALKDVSFKVQQGEVLGIIGRNGAGKSTLLKILSRVTAPTSGKVKVKGRIASLLEVGTGFHPELTGRENVYLNGAILGMSKTEVTRKFDEIVDFAGVEKFIDTPVKRYSSGMYVRLAFAVAAHLEPEILVVDEVLAVGDAEFQKKCLGKMGDVAKEGRTVLFVSHNLGQVNKLCKKGVWLEKGLCMKMGDLKDVMNSYKINTEKLSKESFATPTNYGLIGWKIAKHIDNKEVVTIKKDTLEIEIYFRLETEIESGFIGITLQTSDGFNITGKGVHNQKLSAGLHCAIFEFTQFPLRSASYLVFGSLWDAGKMIDAKTLFPELNISNLSHESGLSEYWSGAATLPCKVKILKTDNL